MAKSDIRSRRCLFKICLIVLCIGPSLGQNTNETEAKIYMEELDQQYSLECNAEMVARWEYITDVMDSDKEAAANAASVTYLAFKGEAAKNCSQYDYETFQDIALYRRYRFLSKQGPGALDDTDLNQYKALQGGMETIYSTATICDYNNPDNCGLELEPEIEEIMATSRDFGELQYVWEEWRKQTGMLMREDFLEFVALSNKAAGLDGFSDTGEYWLNPYTVTVTEASAYETYELNQEEFQQIAESVWNNVSTTLYKTLHSWVRYKLHEQYPEYVDLTGYIPANILGNMWAQDWTNIGDLVMPFPEVPSFDVTDSMIANGWDIDQMFTSSEDFFKSIGLFEMTDTFWSESVINQTAHGKVMVCHASAEDFCLGSGNEDFRIKMCSEVNMVDLVTVHHEMGHIEYFMAYRELPHVFRESANPGFHEALGDLIALSVSTPSHMENILGLTPTRKAAAAPHNAKQSDFTDEQMEEINFLMRMALEKVAFLPFGYLIDAYRWGIFDGSITEANLNAAWWQLRQDLQGVAPPAGARGEEYFDAGAKYHVPANVPYIRYFVSFIVQFQFHQHLCQSIGHNGPLHTCDIYNNIAAGDLIKQSLELGFSEPWPVVLEFLGGSDQMDPTAIINYFQPLIDFLNQELEAAGQCVGWGDECDEATGEPTDDPTTDGSTDEPTPTDDPTTDGSTDEPTPTDDPTTDGPTGTPPDPENEAQAKEAIDDMEAVLHDLIVEASELSWADNIDHTDESAQAANEAFAKVSVTYAQYWADVINFYNYENFKDETLKRRFELQAKPGTAALPEADQLKLNMAISNMTSLALQTVCPYENQECNKEEEGYDMDQLEGVMAEVRDIEALTYYWESWRDLTGAPAKNDFLVYVDLLNQAAMMEENGYKDATEMWLEPYTDEEYTADQFKQEIDDLWTVIKPLYDDLHAYVRHKLRKSEDYKNKFGEESPIPAQILGNMWAQDWQNIYSIVEPYPEVGLMNITETLQKCIKNETEMFDWAEDFFVETGLYPMTETFKDKTMYIKKEGTNPNCHASAWDFYSLKNTIEEGDYRIKMCTDKTQEDFIVIHHEMGHTEYQMAYSRDPNNKQTRNLIFRDGANPGFHEAIGDTVALSVLTQSHLADLEDKISCSASTVVRRALTKEEEDMRNINQLLKMALSKVAFVPYAYILDKFRWEVFEGLVDHSKLNYRWWEMRVEVQGLKPPVLREKDTDFDPGSKYHVAAGVPYIRYFVAHILQFQFHQQLCTVGEIDTPTYLCDIYNNTKAGQELEKLLQKGLTDSWKNQLADFMGSDGNMNASAMVEYFTPLRTFLDEFLTTNSVPRDTTRDVDRYFVQHVPAIVPAVVGVVLCIMILIVIVAFFVGKNKQEKKNKREAANIALSELESQKKRSSVGVDNPGLVKDEIEKASSRKSSVSSDGKRSDIDKPGPSGL